jgi:hypothetical protein
MKNAVNGQFAKPAKGRKADLHAKLRQWMRISQMFAQRRESRFKVLPAEYRILHRDLLHMVSATAAASADPRTRTVFRDLQDTLTPWVNVDSLNRADRDILFGVLEECEAVRRSLRRKLTSIGRWTWIALILIASGFTLGVGLVLWDAANQGNAASDLALSLRRWARWTMANTVGASAHRQLVTGGAIAAVLTMVIVWYSARKY